MRIIYDYQIFSISRYGGALRYFCELISRLAQTEGIDINLFMGHFISEYGLEKYKQYYHNFSGRKHKPYPNSKLFFLFLNKLLFKKFFQKNQADLYHQTYYENFCINNKTKRIVTVLDMMHEIFPESFSKFDKSSSQKKEAIKSADGIISISHSTKNDLINLFNVPEEKIKVIHLGNSLNLESKDEPLVKSPYFLYVAKRIGYKNFKMLLDVFIQLKKDYDNLKLVCCGGGDFNSEERKILTDNNILKDVIYFNANDNTLANLYKNAIAFVYPSLYEGFGVSLLEAMSMKCPIIASNLSSIPEILGSAGLYIDPKSSEDLKQKMEKLINDGELRNELIRKGLIQKKKFSWDKCAKETLEYYKEILGN